LAKNVALPAGADRAHRDAAADSPAMFGEAGAPFRQPDPTSLLRQPFEKWIDEIEEPPDRDRAGDDQGRGVRSFQVPDEVARRLGGDFRHPGRGVGMAACQIAGERGSTAGIKYATRG